PASAAPEPSWTCSRSLHDALPIFWGSKDGARYSSGGAGRRPAPRRYATRNGAWFFFLVFENFGRGFCLRRWVSKLDLSLPRRRQDGRGHVLTPFTSRSRIQSVPWQ